MVKGFAVCEWMLLSSFYRPHAYTAEMKLETGIRKKGGFLVGLDNRSCDSWTWFHFYYLKIDSVIGDFYAFHHICV